jgi:hypothetical protein
MTADLKLPDSLVPLEIAGEGRRSVTWRANYQDKVVALKVYRQAFIDKYQQRFKLNIAQFEHDRNKAFYAIDALRPYAARPIGMLGVDDQYSLCFLQEFLTGPTLIELAQQNHGLPQSVLDAGRIICETAEASGLHDLDIFYKNVMMRKQNDVWLPVLHDFNLLPQYRYPRNPFLALAYFTRLRKRSHRDWRCLKEWHEYSNSCHKTES